MTARDGRRHRLGVLRGYHEKEAEHDGHVRMEAEPTAAKQLEAQATRVAKELDRLEKGELRNG